MPTGDSQFPSALKDTAVFVRAPLCGFRVVPFTQFFVEEGVRVFLAAVDETQRTTKV